MRSFAEIPEGLCNSSQTSPTILSSSQSLADLAIFLLRKRIGYLVVQKIGVSDFTAMSLEKWVFGEGRCTV